MCCGLLLTPNSAVREVKGSSMKGFVKARIDLVGLIRRLRHVRSNGRVSCSSRVILRGFSAPPISGGSVGAVGRVETTVEPRRQRRADGAGSRRGDVGRKACNLSQLRAKAVDAYQRLQTYYITAEFSRDQCCAKRGGGDAKAAEIGQSVRCGSGGRSRVTGVVSCQL